MVHSLRNSAKSGVKYEMFLYKDERFGCFPKASAVALYHLDTLSDSLSANSNIDNRLACIIRDIVKQDYLPLALAVVASFVIQLIEPDPYIQLHHTPDTEAIPTISP